MDENYVIWCTYHDKQQLIDYDLHESEHFKLFNTNDLNMQGDNINYLNEYLAEFVCLYYVWKNNIKSDYVGFCHYRRFFNKIDFEKLQNNLILVYERNYGNNRYNTFLKLGGNHKDLDLFLRILHNKYNFNIEHFNNKSHFLIYKDMFVCKWEIFCEICETIFNDFLNNLIPNWKVKDNCFNFMLNHYNEFMENGGWKGDTNKAQFPWVNSDFPWMIIYLDENNNQKLGIRYLSVMLEYIFGLYIPNIFNTFLDEFRYDKYVLYKSIIDIKYIYYDYKKTLKNGYYLYNVLYNTNEEYNNLQKYYNNYIYQRMNFKKISSKKINIFIIATNKYNEYLTYLYPTLENLFPMLEKHIYLIGDKNIPYTLNDNIKYNYFHITNLPYPFITYNKLIYICDCIKEYNINKDEYFIYIDADSYILQMNEEYWLKLLTIIEDNKICFAISPWAPRKNIGYECGNWENENNTKSASYIMNKNLNDYVQTSLFFGKINSFIDFTNKTLKYMISDSNNKIIPYIYDQSLINKVIFDDHYYCNKNYYILNFYDNININEMYENVISHITLYIHDKLINYNDHKDTIFCVQKFNQYIKESQKFKNDYSINFEIS